MRGRIAKTKGRYYVVIEEGIDARTGRRRRTSHAVYEGEPNSSFWR